MVSDDENPVSHASGVFCFSPFAIGFRRRGVSKEGPEP
jgi:hypothetical protein